jgi:hypothetical protein
MNKTRRRAIQKHRAKEAKFEIRRKNGGEQSVGRPKPPAATSSASGTPSAPATISAQATARPKTSARRREATETAEQ